MRISRLSAWNISRRCLHSNLMRSTKFNIETLILAQMLFNVAILSYYYTGFIVVCQVILPVLLVLAKD